MEAKRTDDYIFERPKRRALENITNIQAGKDKNDLGLKAVHAVKQNKSEQMACAVVNLGSSSSDNEDSISSINSDGEHLDLRMYAIENSLSFNKEVFSERPPLIQNVVSLKFYNIIEIHCKYVCVCCHNVRFPCALAWVYLKRIFFSL